MKFFNTRTLASLMLATIGFSPASGAQPTLPDRPADIDYVSNFIPAIFNPDPSQVQSGEILLDEEQTFDLVTIYVLYDEILPQPRPADFADDGALRIDFGAAGVFDIGGSLAGMGSITNEEPDELWDFNGFSDLPGVYIHTLLLPQPITADRFDYQFQDTFAQSKRFDLWIEFETFVPPTLAGESLGVLVPGVAVPGDTSGSEDTTQALLDSNYFADEFSLYNGGDDVYEIQWPGGEFALVLRYDFLAVNLDLALLDVDGNPIWISLTEPDFGREYIELNNLPEGQYFVRVDTWRGFPGIAGDPFGGAYDIELLNLSPLRFPVRPTKSKQIIRRR